MNVLHLISKKYFFTGLHLRICYIKQFYFPRFTSMQILIICGFAFFPQLRTASHSKTTFGQKSIKYQFTKDKVNFDSQKKREPTSLLRISDQQCAPGSAMSLCRTCVVCLTARKQHHSLARPSFYLIRIFNPSGSFAQSLFCIERIYIFIFCTKVCDQMSPRFCGIFM